jgi:hypothetical protein
MDHLRELYRQFKKSELLHIASLLDVAVSLEDRVPHITKAICDDLEVNGVPEVDECDDLTFEFLVAGEYMDEDGNLLDVDEEVAQDNIIPTDNIPDCFEGAFADSRDPGCNRCSLFKMCMSNRINSRPDCYGRLFDADSNECMMCFEAPACKVEYSINLERSK